ncbi:DnaB-like helicase N-terminal domain-containing protein [Kitasatospora purpeofusca]|uniref:DnaB-like helicase N-terminal domain-containing protein n=1 Tax=Kitasatospora purpeofusca TaxID=67352 RepID=UPI0035E02524
MVTPQMEAEQAVLGAVLLDPRQLAAVSSWLRPAHFYRPAHTALYEVLLAQKKDGHPGLSGDSEARSAWALEAMTTASAACPAFTAGYGHTLIAACPTAGHAASYGRMVLETAIRRQVHEHAHRLLAAARTGHTDTVPQLTGDLRTAITHLADTWGALDQRPVPLTGPWPLELPENTTEETLSREEVLLASLSAAPTDLLDIARWLHPVDFLDSGHQALYQALLALGHRGEAIDSLTVLWEAQHRGALASGAITADRIRRITRVGYSGDPGYWAEQVLCASLLRSATAAAGAVRLLSRDAALSAARLLGSALHVLREAEAVQSRWRTATGGARGRPARGDPEPFRRDAARTRTLAPVPDTAGATPPSPAQQAAPPRTPVRSTH